MADSSDMSIGELSRQVRDVLMRFERLATSLETQFVRSDNFQLYKELVNQAIVQMQEVLRSCARVEALQGIDTELKKKATLEQLAALEARISSKADKVIVDTIVSEISEIQDDKKWITRLVIGFIVLGILAVIFSVNGGALPK